MFCVITGNQKYEKKEKEMTKKLVMMLKTKNWKGLVFGLGNDRKFWRASAKLGTNWLKLRKLR